MHVTWHDLHDRLGIKQEQQQKYISMYPIVENKILWQGSYEGIIVACRSQHAHHQGSVENGLEREFQDTHYADQPYWNGQGQ